METVTIPKAEYDSLVEDRDFLECLQCHGVDNWPGYDDATSDFYGGDEDDL